MSQLREWGPTFMTAALAALEGAEAAEQEGAGALVGAGADAGATAGADQKTEA